MHQAAMYRFLLSKVFAMPFSSVSTFIILLQFSNLDGLRLTCLTTLLLRRSAHQVRTQRMVSRVTLLTDILLPNLFTASNSCKTEPMIRGLI